MVICVYGCIEPISIWLCKLIIFIDLSEFLNTNSHDPFLKQVNTICENH